MSIYFYKSIETRNPFRQNTELYVCNTASGVLLYYLVSI